MSETAFSARDFESLRTGDAVQVLSRPSLSYWPGCLDPPERQPAGAVLAVPDRRPPGVYRRRALVLDRRPAGTGSGPDQPGAGSGAAGDNRRTPYTLGRFHVASPGDGFAARGTGDYPGGTVDLGAHRRRARLPGLPEPVPHRRGAGIRPAHDRFVRSERDRLRRPPGPEAAQLLLLGGGTRSRRPAYRGPSDHRGRRGTGDHPGRGRRRRPDPGGRGTARRRQRRNSPSTPSAPTTSGATCSPA